MKKSLISSYVTQAYTIVIGLVMLPVYLQYLGAESFGLVGVFMMLQAWVQFFDFGMSASLSREMSRYRAGVLDAVALWQRLRSLEWLLGVIAAVVTLVLYLSRGYIASEWLKVEVLLPDQVTACFAAMLVAAVLRWMGGLYRSSLFGLELHAWVNGTGVLFATFRFVLVVPVLIFALSQPLAFFVYQVFVSALELLTYRMKLYAVLPSSRAGNTPDAGALMAMLPMVGSMGMLGGIWIFVTQIDKLILSRVLALGDYGIYTMAMALGGGLLLLIAPLNQILQPRMTILREQGKHDQLQTAYRTASQFTVAMFFSLGGAMALHAEPLLYSWTGDRAVAQAGAPILLWYGMANALVGALVMPFLLQFAHGSLRLHVIGNLLLAATLLPAIIYACLQYGAVGAGATLFVSRLMYLLFWVPRVHARFMPVAVVNWPLRDVCPVVAVVLAVLTLSTLLLPADAGRLTAFVYIGAAACAACACGLAAGRHSRVVLSRWVSWG